MLIRFGWLALNKNAASLEHAEICVQHVATFSVSFGNIDFPVAAVAIQNSDGGGTS